MPRYFEQCLRLQSTPRPSDERGAVIVLFAVAMMTSFLMIALAIDGGHLFQQSLLLQRATDAAALAAAKALAVTPKDQQISQGMGFVGTMQIRAEQVGNENIRRRGALVGAPLFEVKGVNTVADLYKDRVTIVGTMRTKLFLMDKLLRYAPGFESDLKATATAEVQRAMVSIVMDTSASMICLPHSADCSCGVGCIPKRFEQLRDAVYSFVSQFNPERDKFFLNRFSASAFTLVGMSASASTGFDINAIEFALNNANMLGDTNPCDGLYQAWGNTQAAADAFGRNTWGRDYMAYIIFSDGAPTAARFFFDPSVVLALPPTASGAVDYYSWVTLYSPEGVQNASLLAPYPVPWNWPKGEPPLPPLWALQAPPPCSVRNPNNAADMFSNCVTNFTTRTPDGVVWPSTNPPYAFPASPPWPYYREQYYHCTISMADMLRRQGAVVYSIGIGPAAALSTTDPYQNIGENEERKDNLLLRLANDPRAYPENYVAPATFPYDLFPGAFARYIPPGDIPSWYSEGRYYAAEPTFSLAQVFEALQKQIVRKIKSVQLVPTRPDDLT